MPLSFRPCNAQIAAYTDSLLCCRRLSMHIVSSTMKMHRTRTRPSLAGGGPKGPPSAPPTIPPIIINPFDRGARRQPNIDPLRTPLPPPVRPPGAPAMRMSARYISIPYSYSFAIALVA
jgi:hypothetical protein